MALLLALVRKIPESNSRTKAGRWDMRAVIPIHRQRGTVLGLVAFGQIAQSVALKAQAFGMRVVTYDPYVPKEVAVRAGPLWMRRRWRTRWTVGSWRERLWT